MGLLFDWMCNKMSVLKSLRSMASLILKPTGKMMTKLPFFRMW